MKFSEVKLVIYLFTLLSFYSMFNVCFDLYDYFFVYIYFYPYRQSMINLYYICAHIHKNSAKKYSAIQYNNILFFMYFLL